MIRDNQASRCRLNAALIPEPARVVPRVLWPQPCTARQPSRPQLRLLPRLASRETLFVVCHDFVFFSSCAGGLEPKRSEVSRFKNEFCFFPLGPETHQETVRARRSKYSEFNCSGKDLDSGGIKIYM